MEVVPVSNTIYTKFWSNLKSFKQQQKTRYIKVKVEHYLLFMFSPPKIS
jgi:hypothetical protein